VKTTHPVAAFSLVEVLVTVAIVLVLAVMISGATRSALEHTRATQCAANLRQLVTANLAYAAEHGGRYVAAQDPSNNIRWHGVRQSGKDAFDPAQGPLAAYLGAEGRVKICPALADVLTGSGAFEQGSGGYGYNAAYIGGTPADSFSPSLVSRVPQPGQTMMFADTALPRREGLQEYAFAEPFRWEDGAGNLRTALTPSVHFRHGGRANVAWCDGHTTIERPSRIGPVNFYGGDNQKHLVGWFGPEENNGYWRP